MEAAPTDPVVRAQALSPPDAGQLARVMAEKDRLPLDEWLKRLEKVMLLQSPDEAMKVGEKAAGSLAVAFVDQVVTARGLIDSMVNGAHQILTDLPRQFE